MNKITKAMAILGSSVSIISIAWSAWAYTSVSPTLPVSIVELTTGSLLVQTSGTGSQNYVAQLSSVTGTTCAAQAKSSDTIKGFQALAQAALLSGKSVRIYYNDCGGNHHIETMDLNQ